MSAYDLFVQLGLKSTEFNKGIDSAATKAKGFGGDIDKIDKKSKVLGQTFQSLKTIAITAFSGWAIVNIAKSFTEAASTSEQFEVRLKALLGSAEEGNRLFKLMADYAGSVPFEYKNIMEAATQLAGVMKGGVQEIQEFMPIIGNLAAAFGLTIQETTSQVIRMYSAGAASADLFRERGVNAALGFQAGVSYSVDETIAKLKEWGDANQTITDDLAKTWQGSMSMMADAWFQLRNTVMNDTGIFTEQKSILQWMVEAMQGLNMLISQDEKAVLQRERMEALKDLTNAEQAYYEFVNREESKFTSLFKKGTDARKEYILKEALDQAQKEYQIVEDKIAKILIEERKPPEQIKISNEEIKDSTSDTVNWNIKEFGKHIATVESLNGELEITDSMIEALKNTTTETVDWNINSIGKFTSTVQALNEKWEISDDTIKDFSKDFAKSMNDGEFLLSEQEKQLRHNEATLEALAHAIVSDVQHETDVMWNFINDTFNGMSAGVDKFQNDVQDTYHWWESATYKTMNTIRNTMSDLFFDAFTGDLKSMSDYWDAIWKSMVRSATDRMADLALNAAANLIGGAVSGGGGSGGGILDILGGIGSGVLDFLGFSEGTYKVGEGKGPEGTTPAILHPGEMVVPETYADTIRQYLPEAGSFGEQSTFMQAFMKGTAKDFMMNMLQGSSQYGIDTMLDYIPEITLSSMLKGGVPMAMNDLLGFSSDQAKTGAKAGPAILSALGGPGGILGALLGKVGGAAIGEYMADFLDRRTYSGFDIEEALDYMESSKIDTNWIGRVSGSAYESVGKAAQYMDQLKGSMYYEAYQAAAQDAGISEVQALAETGLLSLRPDAISQTTTAKTLNPFASRTYANSAWAKAQTGFLDSSDWDSWSSGTTASGGWEGANNYYYFYRKGGLADRPGIVGEAGPEWVVPTYEPEKSQFMEDTGLNQLLEAIESNGNGQTIHVHVNIDGRQIADAVVSQKDRHPGLARALRGQ